MTTAIPNVKLPADFRFERTFQGIDEITLKNGLKVLLFWDPSQANVTINITYLVGSRHEGRGEAGMAHLLEHMLFRGTHEMRDVKSALQDKGAQFNATTWYDRTNYYEILTPTEENLEFALRLEADRMINSLILQEDLDSEMTVVRNEFEMGENNPVHVLHDQIMHAAYRWHNYGKTTIGNRSDIERVPVKTLRKFYEYYYQPDNAVLVIAGQFSKQKAVDLVAQYFAPLKKPDRVLDETYTEEPAQDGPREVLLERVGDMASVAVGYHIPAASHADHAPLQIFFDALADEPGGLIYQKLVETQKCSEVFSMVYSLHEPGMALCFVRPVEEGQAMDIREELISLVEKTAQTELTEAHIERVKTRALKRIKLAMANSKHMALKLSEAIACGDWRLFFWFRDQLRAVTLKDVLRVHRKYIVSSNRTSGVFIPQYEPHRVAIDRAPVASAVVSHITEDPSLCPGETFIASASNIEKLVTRKEISEKRRVALLSKKTRGQSVKVRLRFRFANEEALLPYVKEYWVIPHLMMRGTKRYDYQMLTDRVDSLMSTLDFDGYAGLLSATMTSERNYLSDMVHLVAHVVSEASFKNEEFLIVRQHEIDNYEETKNDPQRLAFHELERLRKPWPKGHILYVPSFDETIEALQQLTLERTREAYERLFSHEHFVMSVVGDNDSERILDELQIKFAESKSSIPFERIKRPFIKNLDQELALDTVDKEMAIVAYAFNFPLRDDHPDFPALKLLNYMFGENMNSRLMNRIREKEGISYGASSGLEVGRYEENASLSIYAMAAPPSITRAKKAIEEEWYRFIDDGVTDKELVSSKESIWLGFENMLSNDSYLANALVHDLELSRDFFFRESIYQRIKDLTISDLKTAAQKWWGDVSFSKVVAADLAKMK